MDIDLSEDTNCSYVVVVGTIGESLRPFVGESCRPRVDKFPRPKADNSLLPSVDNHQVGCSKVIDEVIVQEDNPPGPNDTVGILTNPEPVVYSMPKRTELGFQCVLCSSLFVNRQSLYRHFDSKHKGAIMKRRVGIVPLKQFPCREEGCAEAFGRSELLRKHLEENHGFTMGYQCFTFKSMKDFEAWKTAEENKTCSLFYCRGLQQRLTVDKWLWLCHRSGHGKRNFSSAKKPWRHDSYKIGYQCTSQIEMAKSGDEITVKYHKDHYKHDFGAKYLPLSDWDRAIVVAQLLQGLSTSKILQNIRSTCDKDTRLYLIKHKDVYNIRKSFGFLLHEGNEIESDEGVSEEECSSDDYAKSCTHRQVNRKRSRSKKK